MKVQKICLLSILIAMAIAIASLEHLIPSFTIPGIKLGLANIVILIILYEFGFKEALLTNVARVILSALITGQIFNLMGFLMSVSGAFLSLIIMWASKTVFKKLSIVGVSVLGSIFHIIAQMLVAMIFIGIEMMFYFPIILLSSIITGIFVGIVAVLILKTKIISKIKKRYNLN